MDDANITMAHPANANHFIVLGLVWAAKSLVLDACSCARIPLINMMRANDIHEELEVVQGVSW